MFIGCQHLINVMALFDNWILRQHLVTCQLQRDQTLPLSAKGRGVACARLFSIPVIELYPRLLRCKPSGFLSYPQQL